MPEDVAFISSKSGVETSLDGKVMSVTKKVPTDRHTAFRLYIVDARYVDLNFCTHCDFLLPVSIILAANHKCFWFMLMWVAWRVETCAHVYRHARTHTSTHTPHAYTRTQTHTHTISQITQQAASMLYQKKL